MKCLMCLLKLESSETLKLIVFLYFLPLKFTARLATVSSTQKIMLPFNLILLKLIQILESWPVHQKFMPSAELSVVWVNQMIALPVWLNVTTFWQSEFQEIYLHFICLNQGDDIRNQWPADTNSECLSFIYSRNY